VLATDCFDRFLADNGLLDFALRSEDDAEILRRFLAASLPEDVVDDLQRFLDSVRWPLAVRSSSLLEDSQHHPFAGVYETFMLPNHRGGPRERLEDLAAAVKRVYASTFDQRVKTYLRATPYRLEEEKMAVLIQKVVGAPHGPRYYPDFSGVARTHNFYPTPMHRSEDGVAAVALGMGRTVVAGERCLLFSPRHPRHLVHSSSVDDVLSHSQRDFWALDLDHRGGTAEAMQESRFGLEVAEADGTLLAVGSTYSPDTHAIHDGLARSGARLVTFAPVLKGRVFPLAEILALLLDLGRRGLNRPAEIEFAVRLSRDPAEPHEFAVLQMRPLVFADRLEGEDLDRIDRERLLCRSPMVLGHGTVELRDIVMVDFHRYDRSRGQVAASEIARYNAELVAQGRPYLLIGVGRWGSADPWLGIPVAWEQIAGARVILESGFRDFRVSPSQGTHFFQNLTSFQVGYFTVNADVGEGFIEWDWLAAQPAVSERDTVRHLRFDQPLLVRMNGRQNQGVIYKPGCAPSR
jgi:pyruvate phosphate dikinase-like enzyme